MSFMCIGVRGEGMLGRVAGEGLWRVDIWAEFWMMRNDLIHQTLLNLLGLRFTWNLTDVTEIKKLLQNLKLTVNCACKTAVSVLSIPNWLLEDWDGDKQGISGLETLTCFLPNSKCSDLAAFPPRKCTSCFSCFSFNFFHLKSFQWSSPWTFLERLLCLLENTWFTKTSLLLIFFYQLLVRTRSVSFTLETKAVYWNLWV